VRPRHPDEDSTFVMATLAFIGAIATFTGIMFFFYWLYSHLTWV